MSQMVIANRWLGVSMGGVEKHIRQVISHLRTLGEQVVVVTTSGGAATDIDAPIIYSRSSRVKLVSMMLYALALLSYLIFKNRQAVVLTFFSFDAYLVRAAKILAPNVRSINVIEENTIFEKIEGARADIVAFTNPVIAEMCDQTKYLELIIASESSTDIEVNIPTNVLKIVTVCRLEPRKNLPLLIEVADSLRQRGVAFRWSIVGIGPSAEDVASDIKKRGLDDSIYLTGFVSNDELDRIYRSSNVFFLSSFFEGFGKVYLEAMARGLPVVCKSGGASAYTVGQGGMVIDSDDPSAFADVLQAFLYGKVAFSGQQLQKNLERFTGEIQRKNTSDLVLSSHTLMPYTKKQTILNIWYFFYDSWMYLVTIISLWVFRGSCTSEKSKIASGRYKCSLTP